MAKEGDVIRFKRHDLSITGTVVKVKEESVLVQISDEDALMLKIDTPITVVSHKNYKIV
ncbi:DUF2187 family protein [Bacillus infantis]